MCRRATGVRADRQPRQAIGVGNPHSPVEEVFTGLSEVRADAPLAPSLLVCPDRARQRTARLGAGVRRRRLTEEADSDVCHVLGDVGYHNDGSVVLEVPAEGGGITPGLPGVPAARLDGFEAAEVPELADPSVREYGGGDGRSRSQTRRGAVQESGGGHGKRCQRNRAHAVGVYACTPPRLV